MAIGREVLEQELLAAIERDKHASEFIVGIFCAALTSYRHDTVLRPFPSPFILEDGSKDFDGLVRLCIYMYI